MIFAIFPAIRKNRFPQIKFTVNIFSRKNLLYSKYSDLNSLHQNTVQRPRPHVSGDFCIRKFFCADTKICAFSCSAYGSYTTVHTYPIRIRPSQRISQQSMRITSAYTKIYGYERPHVSGYTAYTEISTLESVYRNLRIHRAYTADTCGR